MKPTYFFACFLGFFLFSKPIFSQRLTLSHFFPDERVTRHRLPNGAERFVGMEYWSTRFNVYDGRYNLMRTFDYGFWTNNERVSIYNAYINEIGQDTLVKFDFWYQFRHGFRNENRQILLEIGIDTVWRYEFSRIRGLKSRLIGVYPTEKKYSFCLFDTVNLRQQQCFTERNFIRVNASGLGERMVFTKFVDAAKTQQNAVIMNANFDTLMKIRLPDNAINGFLSTENSAENAQMFGIESESNFGFPQYRMLKLYDFTGRQLYSDSLAGGQPYTQYKYLGEWLSKATVVFSQGSIDTSFTLMSLSDFSVIKQFKKISHVKRVNLGRLGEKFLAYGDFGDTLFLYNTDFSLFRKIPVLPSYKAGSVVHFSNNLLNKNDTIEIFYQKSDWQTGRTDLIMANEYGQITESFIGYSSFDISQLPNLKNKLVVIASNGTYVYELETETISTVSEAKNLEISVFPNPFSDKLTIQLEANALKYPLSMRLFDMWGREQKRVAIAENTAKTAFDITDLGHLPSGLYFVYLSDGSRQVVQKVIKQ